MNCKFCHMYVFKRPRYQSVSSALVSCQRDAMPKRPYDGCAMRAHNTHKSRKQVTRNNKTFWRTRATHSTQLLSRWLLSNYKIHLCVQRPPLSAAARSEHSCKILLLLLVLFYFFLFCFSKLIIIIISRIFCSRIHVDIFSRTLGETTMNTNGLENVIMLNENTCESLGDILLSKRIYQYFAFHRIETHTHTHAAMCTNTIEPTDAMATHTHVCVLLCKFYVSLNCHLVDLNLRAFSSIHIFIYSFFNCLLCSFIRMPNTPCVSNSYRRSIHSQNYCRTMMTCGAYLCLVYWSLSDYFRKI